jgi:hypothetical protein
MPARVAKWRTVPMRLAIGLSLLTVLCLHTATSAQPFDPLPAVDLSTLKPADFTDDELDVPAGGNNASHGMPYLLAHFKTFADSVSDGAGDTPRGFINLVVWRNAHDNRPHNMRIMENNLSLAYFYATDRPWNVYHGHPAVKQRVEAVLEFMVSQQSPNGAFSEYAPQKWGLAPTAFATKFLGQTLTLLKRPGAPPIDPKLLERVVAMDRKAILFILDDPDFYAHGKRFSNQFGNVWAGGLAYLALFPDDKELREKLEAKHAGSVKDFFSPAGFPYENDGPDWSYNLGTHASNQRMARFYTMRDPSYGPMRKRLVGEEQSFYEWLSYNAVPMPSGSGFVLNRAVETRGHVANYGMIESNFADELDIVRAFAPTDEEVKARRAKERKSAEKSWPKVEELPIGEFRAYPPYDFLHREHAATHPTLAQRDAARAKWLPYLARERFNHQRVDDRRDPKPTYTYVRRPSYYAAFNTGNQKNEQRLGLGLLWNPQLGALLQSQTGSDTHAWGTRAADKLYEAQSLPARFSMAGTEVPTQVGARDLPASDLVARYNLGAAAAGATKQVRFLDDRIEVLVTHPGEFREQLPLLVLPDDKLASTDSSLTLHRNGGTLSITTEGPVQMSTDEARAKVGPYHVACVSLKARDKLAYTLRIDSGR